MYRQALLDAVREKNEAKLIALVDPHVRSGFGGGGGIDDFRRHWKTSSKESPLWPELEQILVHGGSFRGEGTQRSFWAPYVYAAWPDSIDAFEHVAATGPDVALRSSPSTSAPVVASVGWAILQLVREPAPRRSPSWVHVRTADGKEGWADAGDVRSPIGYRAGFNRVAGEWKMTALVSGD